jgi:protein-disulfide isomerase
MDKPTNASPEPIRLPEKPADEPRPGDVIVISQTTVYYFVIAGLFFIAGFVVAWVVFSTNTNFVLSNIKAELGTTVNSAVSAAMANIQPGVAVQPTETPVPRQNVTFTSAPTWGPADAKVKIVEFSDFQCPFCEIFYKQTYQLIKQRYGDKVQFAFRHFPIAQIHPDAERASMASECANEQGKFWEYHDALFLNQKNLSRDALVQYANQIKVPNIEQFTTCLDSQKYLTKVQDDLNAGINYSVTGTPTFFINGNILVGAQQFATFAAYIDQELAQANQQQ